MTGDVESAEDRESRLRMAARELDEAERAHVGIVPFSRRAEGITAEEAWRIARLRDRLREGRGEIRSGYKLGWTSEAMRRSLGISQPNFGALWRYMDAGGGALDLARLIHPKAEPEFAFRADRALEGDRLSEDEVAWSGRWAVAVEVVDPRWESYEFDWLDNTADGSSAAAYVVGDFRKSAVPPQRFRLTMQTGSDASDGSGEAAMGSPAAAVVWLVARLHERGEVLEPGMVVLTGGITAPVDLARGMTVSVESPELGGCTLRCG